MYAHQLPNVALAAIYDSSVVGSYAFAVRIIALALGFVLPIRCPGILGPGRALKARGSTENCGSYFCSSIFVAF